MSDPDAVSTAVALARHPSLVMIKDTPKGRGIFTTAPIPSRTLIDTSPVLILGPTEVEMHIRHTQLWFYTYNWPIASTQHEQQKPHPAQTQTQTQALPLGLGSLFNHASARSRGHNTGFLRNIADQTISYITLRDVDAGEELCICYGEDGRLGFPDADADAGARASDTNAGEEHEQQQQRERSDNAHAELDAIDHVRHIDISVFADIQHS